MALPRCAFCKRFKREDQLMETHSHKMICVDCSEEHNMCMTCGSTSSENMTASGQKHYEDACL